MLRMNNDLQRIFDKRIHFEIFTAIRNGAYDTNVENPFVYALADFFGAEFVQLQFDFWVSLFKFTQYPGENRRCGDRRKADPNFAA